MTRSRYLFAIRRSLLATSMTRVVLKQSNGSLLEEHEHTTDCYETVVSYICGLTESEGAHIHEADCFETQRVLICDIPEGESSESAGQNAHVHTDDCYEKVLICSWRNMNTPGLLFQSGSRFGVR